MRQPRLRRNPLRPAPVYLQRMPLQYTYRRYMPLQRTPLRHMRRQPILRWLLLRREQFLRQRVLRRPPLRLSRGRRHRQRPLRCQVL